MSICQLMVRSLVFELNISLFFFSFFAKYHLALITMTSVSENLNLRLLTEKVSSDELKLSQFSNVSMVCELVLLWLHLNGASCIHGLKKLVLKQLGNTAIFTSI